MRRRRGFSYIEMLVVLTVIGIVSRIGIPRYWKVRKQAQARAAVADVRAVRDAILNYHQDRNGYPVESPPGTIPPGTMPLLPAGFSFERESYQLDYEKWDANPSNIGERAVIGLAVESPDSLLTEEIRKLGASGLPYFTTGNRTIFLFSGLPGIS